jgi:hypothetical protein
LISYIQKRRRKYIPGALTTTSNRIFLSTMPALRAGDISNHLTLPGSRKCFR